MKSYIPKILIGFSLCIALGVFSFIGLWKLSSARNFQFFGESITQIKTPQKVVALSFDDGPTPKHTEPVLQILKHYDVQATFFVTGRESEKHLTEAKKIMAAGHELGNHSYSHPRLIFKSPAYVRRQLERTDNAIRAAGWQGPIHFRPPFGKRLFVLPWLLAQQGRKTIMWSIEPESYPEVAATAEGIAKHVIKQTQPGSIILLHVMYNSRETSRQALPLIIEGLQARGYRFKTVNQLLTNAP